MKLIVGLGNPGKEYENTRHNMGFIMIDKFANKYNAEINKSKFNGLYTDLLINNEKVILLKPQSYINLSGEVIRKYIDVTNRRVTFEYIMLENVNDSEENAIELSKLLKGMNCYVNLIPYNETENIEFKRTKNDKIMKFYDILKKNRINVTIRKEFGSKVDAACGQLRANQEL